MEKPQVQKPYMQPMVPIRFGDQIDTENHYKIKRTSKLDSALRGTKDFLFNKKLDNQVPGVDFSMTFSFKNTLIPS